MWGTVRTQTRDAGSTIPKSPANLKNVTTKTVKIDTKKSANSLISRTSVNMDPTVNLNI